MKCPMCAEADLIHDTRDLPYTYKGESTSIPEVTGDFCPACGEAILDAAVSARTSAMMLAVSASRKLSHPRKSLTRTI